MINELKTIEKDLKTYGIRNNSIICEPPKELQSKLIKNECCGVETIHNIKVIIKDNDNSL